MRKLAIVVLTAVLGVLPGLAVAQELVLKRVMLSSGGLGYFEYGPQSMATRR